MENIACRVCEFCILLYSQTLKSYIFDILQHFTTKLYNFTRFRKLFPTVLKLFLNLKDCLMGEWSISNKKIRVGDFTGGGGGYVSNSQPGDRKPRYFTLYAVSIQKLGCELLAL